MPSRRWRMCSAPSRCRIRGYEGVGSRQPSDSSWLIAESFYLHYHLFVREKVLRYIRERKLMRAGYRVCVAVSGGADSVALLRVLLELRTELGIVISVAHFNHGLRGETSEADEAFVAELARQYDLEFFCGRGDVRDHALTSKLSVEAAARELRYCWLTLLAETHKLDEIATGHTLDDQAETVLLKFLRGAGTRGLAGIYPEIGSEGSFRRNTAPPLPGARIVRPLLGVTREEVELYLTALGQSWREDESNLDHRFARNRVRHGLLPLLEREYNPNIRQVLSDAAELSRAEEEYWNVLMDWELEARQRTKTEIPPGLKPDGPVAGNGTAGAVPFQSSAAAPCPTVSEPASEAAERTEGSGSADLQVRVPAPYICHPKPALAGGGSAFQAFSPGAEAVPRQTSASEQRLSLVNFAELRLTLRSVPVPQECANEAGPPESLLGAELLGPELVIRNWRPGDCFWPLHSKSEEKLKRLFSERHIPAEQRPSWPVVLSDPQIVWVLGFPVGRAFAWSGSGDAVKIELL